MQEEEERDQALQAKASLAIPLVPETEDDRRLAALLKFHTLDCAWGPVGLGSQVGGDGGVGAPAEGGSGPPSPPQRTRTSRSSSGQRSSAAPGSPPPREPAAATAAATAAVATAAKPAVS